MRYPNTKCIICSAEFYARPGQKANGEGKYCSRKCYAEDKQEHEYPFERECETCKKSFQIISHRYLSRKFCSHSCAAKSSNKQRKGIKFSAKDEGTFRKRLIETYGHACMICGYTTFVDGHHIIPRSDGGLNILENGILLCPNHHREADRRKLTIECLLKAKEEWTCEHLQQV